MTIRKLALLAVLLATQLPAQRVRFDWQTFLDTFKDRLRSDPALGTVRSGYEPILQLDGQDAGWQANFMALPDGPIREIRHARGNTEPGPDAGFAMALAYLASKQTGAPFTGAPGSALVYFEGADPSDQFAALDPRFTQFGNLLLQAVFDDSKPCSLQGFMNYNEAETQFSNLICQDLKRLVSESRTLMRAKEAADAELKNTHDLLSQPGGRSSRDKVAAAQQSLEVALQTENAEEIQAETHLLETENRALSQEIQAQQAPAAAAQQQPAPARASWQLPETFWNFLVVALALDWLYCFVRGFQNQIVLYFDKKDVFASIVGPLAMVASYWAFDAGYNFWGPALLAGGVVAAFYSIRSSVHYNASLSIGLIVGVFKISFALLWIGLVFGQLGRGSSKTSRGRREQVIGLLVFALLLVLMEKLINGPAVSSQRAEGTFQPA